MSEEPVDDKPISTVERPVDEIVQERTARRRDRRIVAVALGIALISVIAVAAIALMSAIERGKDVDRLAPALDASRQQVEYCARATTPKNDPKCQTPVAPAAREIVGKQGIQGIQGPEGPAGKNGKDGHTPPCLLEANRCVGARGIQGVQGIQGIQGIQGVPGKNGKDGLTPPCMQTEAQCQGADGKDGKDGTNGTDGKNGTDGTNGTDGKNGRGIVDQRCNTETQQIEFTYTDAPDTWVPLAGSDCVADSPTPPPPTSPAPLINTR